MFQKIQEIVGQSTAKQKIIKPLVNEQELAEQLHKKLKMTEQMGEKQNHKSHKSSKVKNVDFVETNEIMDVDHYKLSNLSKTSNI